jgi:hypothetical protein
MIVTGFFSISFNGDVSVMLVLVLEGLIVLKTLIFSFFYSTLRHWNVYFEKTNHSIHFLIGIYLFIVIIKQLMVSHI